MRSRPPESLRRFFAGITEHAFATRVGMADPPLVDYVAEMLTRFVSCDAVYRVRDLAGRRLVEVAQMLAEANARVGDARRDVHRHIGDFALFWTGLYPEALPQLQGEGQRDYLLDYREQGKRAYYIASTIPSGDTIARSELLRRLSDEFDICVHGLTEVRREWEQRDDDGPGGIFPVLLN
ncbi:MAG: hypothetical protein DWQ31_02740 [Planctomycetota bacterium]|nr:MAG: hypothetical protein DWQ31_02740 [Planctomycetota bacterium]REJ92317.1 MAG: hypothetical protein DWQ35_12460 [Planctomycetota bacterium]REK30258.1 MAG: hypothetical protein DWQ42_02495 [Planctomycetota bacterium]REK43450.1 MAG: hypothetical protein DWQ46_11100 [Planctomycetota bacterium]